MINDSALSQYFENRERNDPTTGITHKLLFNEHIEIMYITVCKNIDRTDIYKTESERAQRYMGVVEKDLKASYKEATGDVLKLTKVNETEYVEHLGMWAPGGGQSSYFRLIRLFHIDAPKCADFKVAT